METHWPEENMLKNIVHTNLQNNNPLPYGNILI